TELGYDFINVIPPMKAPEVVRNSPLPWQQGAWGQEGWVEVDRHTLRHVRYPNVFGVGDIAGVPKGKTAASVKWQVPVAVEHLLADIAGSESSARYDGYTSCPLITRLGRAMLIEFDYQNNLKPSFPGVITPLEELWTSWVMKTMALKPTYISMLRGRARVAEESVMKELDPMILLAVFLEMLGPLLWLLLAVVVLGTAAFVALLMRERRIAAGRLVRAQLAGLLGGVLALVLMAWVSSSGFTDAAGPIDWILIALVYVLGMLGTMVLVYTLAGWVRLLRGEDAAAR